MIVAGQKTEPITAAWCVFSFLYYTSSKLAGLHGVKIASDPQGATKGAHLK